MQLGRNSGPNFAAAGFLRKGNRAERLPVSVTAGLLAARRLKKHQSEKGKWLYLLGYGLLAVKLRRLSFLKEKQSEPGRALIQKVRGHEAEPAERVRKTIEYPAPSRRTAVLRYRQFN